MGLEVGTGDAVDSVVVVDDEETEVVDGVLVLELVGVLVVTTVLEEVELNEVVGGGVQVVVGDCIVVVEGRGVDVLEVPLP